MLLKDADRARKVVYEQSRAPIGFNVIAVILLSFALTGVAITANDVLPPLFLHVNRVGRFAEVLAGLVALLTALALLWVRRRSLRRNQARPRRLSPSWRTKPSEIDARTKTPHRKILRNSASERPHDIHGPSPRQVRIFNPNSKLSFVLCAKPKTDFYPQLPLSICSRACGLPPHILKPPPSAGRRPRSSGVKFITRDECSQPYARFSS